MILGLCGSLRAQSSNLKLLQIAAELGPVEIWPDLGRIPPFNPDLDGEGQTPPPEVARLRQAVASATALLISTPEYAHGLPGAFKNALDWLVSSPAMIDKPVVLLFGSAGDAAHARASLIEILLTMSARVVAEVGVPGVRTNADDPETRTKIAAALQGISPN